MRAWIAILLGGGVVGMAAGAVIDTRIKRSPHWLDWGLLAISFVLWAMLVLTRFNAVVE